MKTALIVDGNYLLNRAVFILYNMKTLHVDLLNLLRIDIEKIQKIYNFDKIYYVSDSKVGYWRKQIYNDYKSSRKKNENIDWKFVFNEYNTFLSELKNNDKIEQVQINYAEGDDLIGYIVNENNKNGFSNMIIASDGDLHQLLKFDIHNNYINFAYNYMTSNEKVFMPKNYNIFINENLKNSMSLFDMNNDSEFIEFLETYTSKIKTIEVIPEEILFKKLIAGDKKDTITSVYELTNEKGKKRGIGGTGACKMYNLYKETYKNEIDFNSDEFINNSLNIISVSKKIKDELILNEVKQKLIRNRKLTILDKQYLPEYVLESFNNINFK